MKRRRFLTVTVGVMALSVGLVLANYGGGVAPAAAAPPVKVDPLAGVTQNWDKILPAATRFVILSDFGGAAVRDNETGLVWEQSPALTPDTWSGARDTCIIKNVGGRRGWRLPSIPELASLIDPNGASAPWLPSGHPFTNVQPAFYWSATANAEDPTNAWSVNFGQGPQKSPPGGKTLSFQAWCVRGGMNADAY
jgi:hypothetical protein